MSTKYRASKKVALLILVMMMVIGSLPEWFTAGEGKAYAAGYSSGDGSEVNPYLVTTPEELNDIRMGTSKHYKLGNNIDLTEYLSVTGAGYNNGAFWNPINGFTGSLDGDGHVIRGLKINRTDTGNANIGLFGEINHDNALIRNIGLENVQTKGWFFTGSVAGTLRKGTLSSIYSTGEVNASSYAGGLVGYQEGGSISNTYSSAQVNGVNIGGLVGWKDGGSISNSYAVGSVSLSNPISIKGGLVGAGGNPIAVNSYYDRTTTGGIDNSVKGTPKTTAEMQQQSTFADWDFNDVWVMLPNMYPQLRAFVAQTPVASLNPADGPVTVGTEVTLTSGTAGASIYYTTNGDDPTAASELYDPGEPIEINDDVTIKAIAVYPGKIDSLIMSNSYEIVRPDAPSTGALEPGTLLGTTKLSQVTALMEYKLNDGEFQPINGTSVDNISVTAGDKIYVRFVADSQNAASYQQELTVAQTHIHTSSTDATLTSTLGTVSSNGDGNETITAIPYGTTLAALKDAITAAADATYEVYNADGITVASSLATGSKIIVTAQDGTTKVTYTVTVLKNTDATLTSTLGTVSSNGNGNETITAIPYGTTLAALKAAITPAADATYEVYNADGITVASSLATGSKVIVTAQDGVTKVTYTVTVNQATTQPIGGGSGGGAPVPGKVTSTDGKLTLPTGSIGEVSLDDGITITVPTGAVDQELKLTITKLLDTRNFINNKEILAGSVYEVLKNISGNFKKPVTLTLAFDAKKVKSGQGVAVFYFDEAKKAWVEVKGGKTSGNHITVEVNHFTKFAVLVVDQTTGLPVSEATTPAEPETSFSDIAGHWAEASIKQAVKEGIVNGYVDGTFKPGSTVTRAEFTVMLMKVLKPQAEAVSPTFTDMATIGGWAQKAVAQAVQSGIIKGYPDDSFRPNAEMTRSEVAVLIAKALSLAVESNTATGFADDKEIPTWAKGAVAEVKKLGIVQGRGDNHFAPHDPVTRAEAVTVLLKMLAAKK
ncbi:S-layer homology domain-containing protein [Cohnella boryungensis]|uniref:S-layer homology domain-containing protein n=1 Tax=Cohnella boryungensis TaxID=768479 RepID=A0ABV8SCI6_9BACL